MEETVADAIFFQSTTPLPEGPSTSMYCDVVAKVPVAEPASGIRKRPDVVRNETLSLTVASDTPDVSVCDESVCDESEHEISSSAAIAMTKGR